MVAKIAVDAATFAIDKPYSYRIPQEMTVRVGMRVMVPFGRGNRRTEGIVLSLASEDTTRLKCIEVVLDAEPIINEKMLRLAAFVRERYFCTFYQAIKAMLPVGLWYRTVNLVAIAETARNWREEITRQSAAVLIMELLEAAGGQAEYQWLRQQTSDEQTLQAGIRYLLKKKLIRYDAEMLQRAKDKTERLVSLAIPAEDALTYAESKRKSAPMQYEVLRLLTAIRSTSSKEICYFTGCNMATLRRLEKLGYLEMTDAPVFRRVETHGTAKAEPIVLTDTQENVFLGLRAQLAEPKPGAALLYGVTGSGKTAVYLMLIRDCLDRGEAAMMLVPEIGLTPQFLSLFRSHFGEQVAVLHSGLRVGERYDEWRRIKSGAARVIIGTRSAVFAPAENLRLIIVDEEQEHTYKSENAPRYHAREIALFRGMREHALVLLGSATPSIETMFHAKNGALRFYTLQNRYNGGTLPSVTVVDMKQELKSGNQTAISEPLRERILDNLNAGRQTILFLNRRGTGRCLVCVECGDVPQCPRCSVNLTYHAANSRIMCHYCGYSEPLPTECAVCGGHLKPLGTGTQKVMEELAALFPGTRVLRMDADTISATNSHEKMLSVFEKEQIPILLGTQMVAKGLNFENVTLVGVLDADMSLYINNFRASETTFSMITQVVGRSGRGAVEGSALIQTMTPENAVIRLAAEQDYDRFYEMEIHLRELRGSPPFQDVLVFTFSSIYEERAAFGAHHFRQMLSAALSTVSSSSDRASLLGPAPAAVVKVSNRYRYRLTLSCVNKKNIRLLLAQLLRDFARDGKMKGISAVVDINPYDG